MAGELFKTVAGVDLVHVPYRNSGEARSGIIGGQVQMMIDAVTAMAPNVSHGQVRALAITGKRAPACCPTCRRWPRPVCPVTKPPSGSD
jgi:tripartite-type tricarboxylate transporter receptor subunit TctC